MDNSTQDGERGFRVSHQKVSIDVDLATCTIQGWTELTIVPTDGNLKQIRLDARQMQVHAVNIDNRPAVFSHQDYLVSQTHLGQGYGSTPSHTIPKRRLRNLLTDSNTGELTITIPKGVRLTPLESGSASESLLSMGNLPTDGTLYNPLTIKVDYAVNGSTAGFRFVGGAKSGLKRSFWHAYTSHNPIGQATSTWVPCVDGLWELCTWKLEISVVKTLKQLRPNEEVEAVEDDDDEADSNEEDEREILVVCNTATPQQDLHPFFRKEKKVVSFRLFTAVSAHHVGFAVGPFQHTSITELRRVEEDYEVARDSGASISVYALPDKTLDVSNSCLFLDHALEYFSGEFGSYPFSTYCVCFVSELEVDSVSAASLAICNEKLLFGQDLIEPIFSSTKALTYALASQWSGVNVVPKTWHDLWLTNAIAYYMSFLYFRKLMGNNEYKFMLKKRSEEICNVDVNKPPIGSARMLYPVFEQDLDFMRLKGPVVLFILNKRMTKTDGSLGLSRVLPKLFLQAMSGDLKSCLSTAHFIKLCERVGHSRLEAFFDQWVYGSGFPIFHVTQRFNKKRMVVEMSIRQMQISEAPVPSLDKDRFFQDSTLNVGSDEYKASPIFTGPMTIRIHEADGTPYEHVVDLKETHTKLDIQYNTKYKRLRRRHQRKAAAPGTDIDDVNMDGIDGDEGVLLHCLGDVLQSEKNMRDWRLKDWGKDEEDHMINEAFEWIRIDSDFEWICKMFVNQPDYMYVSQLQQDRAVEAQYDAVRFLANSKPKALFSTILVRTLMDNRYFYGIRVEAAMGLAKMAVPETEYVGQYHLLKAFQRLFCFEGSLIPAANNFSDFPLYFIQMAIPRALSRVKDGMGNCPINVRKFLLDLLRYNDNSSNDFNDCFYVVRLIEYIADGIRSADKSSAESLQVANEALVQIDRVQRMDRWIASRFNMVTIAAMEFKRSLARSGHFDVITGFIEEALQFSHTGHSPEVRVKAFQNLLSLGGYQHEELLYYFFFTMNHDRSNYIRHELVGVLSRVLGEIALEGDFGPSKVNGAAASANGEMNGNAFVIQESNDASITARKEQLARQTLSGAAALIQKSLGRDACLHTSIVDSLADGWLTDIFSKRTLLEICEVIFPEKDSVMVSLPLPRDKRLVARVSSDNSTLVTISRRLYTGIQTSANGSMTNTSMSVPPSKRARLARGSTTGAGTATNDAGVKKESSPAKSKIKLKLKV